MVLNKTVKLDDEIKNKLDTLDFVNKKHTYNEIIAKLVEEYENKRKISTKYVKGWNK